MGIFSVTMFTSSTIKEHLMQQDKSTEVLIVRNTCVKQLYDVIRVDFFKEDIEYLAKAIDFVQAVGIVEEFEQNEEIEE